MMIDMPEVLWRATVGGEPDPPGGGVLSESRLSAGGQGPLHTSAVPAFAALEKAAAAAPPAPPLPLSPIITVISPRTIVPPCAVMSPMRAAGSCQSRRSSNL